MLDGLRDLGFVKLEHRPRPASGCSTTSSRSWRPSASDEFTFSRDWLRGVFAHINDPRQPNYAVGYKLNLPPEYLLIHRVWGGGIGVLCQLGGTVRGREIVDALLPGADLPPVGRRGTG